jgi:hypothetical protein
MSDELWVLSFACRLPSARFFVLAFKITVDRRMYIRYLDIKLSDYIKVS